MNKLISRLFSTLCVLACAALFSFGSAQEQAWIPYQVGEDFPSNTIIGGQERNLPQYICRIDYRGGNYPGRVFFRPFLPPTCNIGFGSAEVFDLNFEILVGSNVSWASLEAEREGALVGGQTPQGEQIAVCHSAYQGGVHVGYLNPSSGCVIGYGNRAVAIREFEILYRDGPIVEEVQEEVQPEQATQEVVVETTTTPIAGGLTSQLIVPVEEVQEEAAAPMIAPQSILITPMTNVLSCEQTVALRPETYISLKGGSDYNGKIEAMNQWLNCSSALNSSTLETLGEKGEHLASVRTAMLNLVNSQKLLSDLRNGDATISAELHNQQKISVEKTISDLAEAMSIGQDAFEAEPLAALIGKAKTSIIGNVGTLQQVDANLLARNLGQGRDFAGSWLEARNLYIESLNTLNQTNIEHFPNSLLEYEVMDLTSQLTDNWIASLALP